MKIIITGPNGYIAKNIIMSLGVKKKITLLSHKKIKSSFLNKFEVLKFDLKKRKIPNLNCDILIHAAAITPQKSYSWKEFNNVNFLSLKSIIKKIKIKNKLIFFSTTDIYKNQNLNFLVKEHLKINHKEISGYAKSKYNCENFLKNLNKKKYPFKKLVLRLPGIVGKKNHDNFISNLTKNIILKKQMIYYGGDNLFNNIYHIDTLVKLIKILIKKKIKKNFDIINTGTNKPIKINKIIQILKGKINKKNIKVSKKDMFTIDVTKLNKYYKSNPNTKFIIKKYFKEKINSK